MSTLLFVLKGKPNRELLEPLELTFSENILNLSIFCSLALSSFCTYDNVLENGYMTNKYTVIFISSSLWKLLLASETLEIIIKE